MAQVPFRPGVTLCGLSLLLARALFRGFSPGFPVFLPPQKLPSPNPNSTRKTSWGDVDSCLNILEVKASTSSSDNADKEMKSYMDQMDEELSQTSIAQSFEKVNVLSSSG